MKSGIASLFQSKSTVLTPAELAAVWGIANVDYLKTRIQYYLKRGYLRRVTHGLYAKSGADVNLLEAGNRLRTPSYVSFETVLFQEGLIFQAQPAVYLASYCSKTIQISIGKFVYRRLKDEILFSKEGVISAGSYCVATKERAFLDSIYARKVFHVDNLRPLDWGRVEALTYVYDSKALARRVKEFKRDA